MIDVGGQPLGDGAGTVGGTVEGGIVQYVEDTVLTDADIAFYIAYTVFDARIYGCQLCFGSDGGGTTVCAGLGVSLVVAAGRWNILR